MLRLPSRPKCLAYVTRTQGRPCQSMFDPNLYQQLAYNTSTNTTLITQNTMKKFDSAICNYIISSILDGEHKRLNTDCSDDTNINITSTNPTLSLDNTSDLTLVNSTFASSDNIAYFNESYLMQYSTATSCHSYNTQQSQQYSQSQENGNPIQIGDKRKFESLNDYSNDNGISPPYKRPKVSIDQQQFISSDFTPLSDGIEVMLMNNNTDTYNYFQDYNEHTNANNNNTTSNYDHFSQLKPLNDDSFPIYTNHEIKQTAISSFDPICHSED